MRKIIFIFIGILFLSQFISAEIIINKQPDELYNLGDLFSIPITIKSMGEVSGIFQMDLICGGHEVNFYKNGVGLAAGEEKKMEPSIVLEKNVIGELKGDCVIKGIFNEDYILTNEFKILNLINIQITSEETEFNPGDNVLITGGATKENGKNVKGFIQLEILSEGSLEISRLETVNNGFFSINLSIPEDMKAGTYLVNLNVYEKDLQGEITNNGFTNYDILIKQVPTNLEIAFENQEVEPGTNLRVKAILHDQTGEKIESIAIITIKNKDDKIMEQTEKQTDEFLEFPIAYNEPSEEWTVVAVSNRITSESNFEIKEKEDIKIELINRTVIITNTGNIPYNRTILVKIGDEPTNINTFLEVDEIKKYVLSAPDGEYEIEIMADEELKITGMATLTGKKASVKEAPKGIISFIRYPIVWIFIIFVLGFIAFMVLKKGYKRNFFGRILPNKRRKEKRSSKKGSIVNSRNKAELSLSIKGDKQNIGLVCLKIKNFKEIESSKEKDQVKKSKEKSKEGNSKETLQKIVNTAEENKAIVYTNQDNIFFMLVPTKTRTFKNERTAINIAKKIEDILTNHNKLFRQKIEFGISLNYGTIIAKQEKESLKFMSMGTLITTAKKIASLSDEEILLSEKIKERLVSDIKTEKTEKGNITVYTIKEIKHREDNKKFISSFIKRIEGKK